MKELLIDFMTQHRPLLEAALAEAIPSSDDPHAGRLDRALHDAVFPGGKRWRPMLALIGARIVGGSLEAGLPAACAVEFLHTSSIVLDDLPSMDDASMRRGRPALHVIYGESLALLAALALLNESYALLLRAAAAGGAPGAAEKLVGEAAHAIGVRGMIGGQASDLIAAQCADALPSRSWKTNTLLRLTMTCGAMACGAGERETIALARFGECLGTAYQICDDLLDELAASEATGKPSGQDARHARPSYVRELGIAEAHRFAVNTIEEGKRGLHEQFGDREEVALLGAAADLIATGSGRLEINLAFAGS
ncbi:MAG: polyprenyl synthetase family protein [Acidobacteria bacterium]|nr:polyprenyl synthetase family protein [Acidobacteriota bacterium]MCW5969618.1 polyprenyl synthetase family protein [Blastocatellales bacterium]